MKQKYTLSIADVELNVIVDESPDTVDHIVGILDRKMREILLRSKQCPKTQAALLCALDFCADKIQLKEEVAELKDQLEGVSDDLKKTQDMLVREQRKNLDIEKDKARIEIENVKLKAIIENAKANNQAPVEDIESVAAEAAQVAEQEAQKASAVENVVVTKKSKSTKSRVGSMFDMLTFSDI